MERTHSAEHAFTPTASAISSGAGDAEAGTPLPMTMPTRLPTLATARRAQVGERWPRSTSIVYHHPPAPSSELGARYRVHKRSVLLSSVAYTPPTPLDRSRPRAQGGLQPALCWFTSIANASMPA